jgi:hypothetical protein
MLGVISEDGTGHKKAPLRLAVIGSPRSGNTWIRAMLGSFYGLEQIPIHSPTELDWSRLPMRCVIQLHWYPAAELLNTLDRSGVRVVMPIRHPFDVLISWLNYNYYVHEEEKCPGTCDECVIAGVSPTSKAFVDYASGYHGRSLLCHGPAWLTWARSFVRPLRYEDLVTDPVPALAALEEWVGEPFQSPIAAVVEDTSIERLVSSRGVWQYHYWQGRPGLWRQLIPAAEARTIAAGVREPFDLLGYDCDPEESLTPLEAERNWLRLQLDSSREHLRLEKGKHRATMRELESFRHRLAG